MKTINKTLIGRLIIAVAFVCLPVSHVYADVKTDTISNVHGPVVHSDSVAPPKPVDPKKNVINKKAEKAVAAKCKAHGFNVKDKKYHEEFYPTDEENVPVYFYVDAYYKHGKNGSYTVCVANVASVLTQSTPRLREIQKEHLDYYGHVDGWETVAYTKKSTYAGPYFFTVPKSGPVKLNFVVDTKTSGVGVLQIWVQWPVGRF